MKLFVVVLTFILVSCNGQKKAAVTPNDIPMESADKRLELILQQADSSFDQTETMIIRDAKNLQSFYIKLNMTRKPGLPVPVVDFSSEMIIIKCNGEQKGIKTPVLTFIKETDSKIMLSSGMEKLSENTSSQDLTTRPFCIYKMPLTKKEIVVE